MPFDENGRRIVLFHARDNDRTRLAGLEHPVFCQPMFVESKIDQAFLMARKCQVSHLQVLHPDLHPILHSCFHIADGPEIDPRPGQFPKQDVRAGGWVRLRPDQDTDAQRRSLGGGMNGGHHQPRGNG